MYKLKLLILCLLVGFKSFSQTDTKDDSVVVLSESQAKNIIKDLLRYDALKLTSSELENRIAVLKEKEKTLIRKLAIKDSIIFTQSEYIITEDKIIKEKYKLKFKGHVGVQTSFVHPMIYFRTYTEIGKFNVGARVFIEPKSIGGYGLIIEYRVF